MDIQNLKQHILENSLISTILEQLGCHHITHKSGYWQCANPDGDNPTAISVYENDNLTTVDYTRNISKNKYLLHENIHLIMNHPPLIFLVLLLTQEL